MSGHGYHYSACTPAAAGGFGWIAGLGFVVVAAIVGGPDSDPPAHAVEQAAEQAAVVASSGSLPVWLIVAAVVVAAAAALVVWAAVRSRRQPARTLAPRPVYRTADQLSQTDARPVGGHQVRQLAAPIPMPAYTPDRERV